MDAVGAASLSSSGSHRWRDVRLGDLCDHVTVGHVGKMSDQYVDRGVPLLRSQDVRPFQLALDHAKRISPEFHGRLRKSALLAGDVVIVRTGYPGTTAVVPPNVTELNCADLVVIRPGGDLDPWFLAAHFNSRHGRALVSGQLVGVAQQHFNVGVAANMQLSIPGSRDQRRIGAVVRAFSELIEINERRIALLEDLARSLYREWFVRFRFPGHEEVELVDSELGPIPEGWEVQPVGEVFDVLGGGTPSKKQREYWTDGTIPWFTPSDLTRSRWRFVVDSAIRITDLGLAKSSARLFPAGSVLMTSRATLGVLAIAARDATCNQGFIVIPPVVGVASAFLYEWLVSRADELERIATGATFKEITKGAFKRVPFLLPPLAVLTMFAQVAEPLDQQIATLEATNQQLAATRDLLLPRLVTGRLDISDVDLGVLTPTEAG
jgi:type I restriction enzyme S subunit